MSRKHPSIVVIVIAALGLLTFWVVRSKRAALVGREQQQTFPHRRIGPEWAYPDSNRTPGATNPAISQANLQETICGPEWTTKSVRPPASYTSRLKREQMRDWGLPGTTADYEEDHLISLELGGHPTDPRNLWPEAYEPSPGAREKDVVENYLHRQVCSGAITLDAAQNAIATDWYKVYLEIEKR